MINRSMFYLQSH